jgi:hypothetical protein
MQKRLSGLAMTSRKPASKQRASAESYVLGAETRPGGLAEINRIYQAWHDPAARNQRSGNLFQPLGLITIAMHWLKNSSTRFD